MKPHKRGYSLLTLKCCYIYRLVVEDETNVKYLTSPPVCLTKDISKHKTYLPQFGTDGDVFRSSYNAQKQILHFFFFIIYPLKSLAKFYLLKKSFCADRTSNIPGLQSQDE